MKFSTVFSTALCFTGAFAATLGKRTLHQHIAKRTSTDLCVSLDLNLDLNLKGILHDFGHLDACICLSTVGLFIEENAQVKAAIKALGPAGDLLVKEKLLAAINGHHNKKKCTYPPNGKPAPAPKCSPNANPCGFTCNNGFVAQGNQCVCPRPNVVYNGHCGPKPGKPGQPQPSGKPRSPPTPPKKAPSPPKKVPVPPKKAPTPPKSVPKAPIHPAQPVHSQPIAAPQPQHHV